MLLLKLLLWTDAILLAASVLFILVCAGGGGPRDEADRTLYRWSVNWLAGHVLAIMAPGLAVWHLWRGVKQEKRRIDKTA